MFNTNNLLDNKINHDFVILHRCNECSKRSSVDKLHISQDLNMNS